MMFRSACRVCFGVSWVEQPQRPADCRLYPSADGEMLIQDKRMMFCKD